MLYVARTLFMPSGEELSSKVVAVSDGVLAGIRDFVEEKPSMLFVNEVYVSASNAFSSVDEIKDNKEAHRADGPLYVYSADAVGNLELLG